MIGFSPLLNRESRRRINAEERGEFVVNIVSEEFAKKMNATAIDVPPEGDEFELSIARWRWYVWKARSQKD